MSQKSKKALCCSTRKLYAKGLCREHFNLDFPCKPLSRKSHQQLAALWFAERQHYICAWCSGDMNDIKDTQLDHIIPLSKGGVDNFTNLQAVHKICNLLKGDKA